MTVKPITPKEAKNAYGAGIPDFVFEAFNAIIAESGRHGTSFLIFKDAAVKAVLAKAKDAGINLERQDVFDLNYLDVENHYKAAGWEVSYTKRHYSESGDVYFSFAPKE